MSLITTEDGQIVIKKADSMMVVPYVYDSTIGDYVLGQDVYDISAVIGDSIVTEQSEGNTESKYNEFVGSPLLECVSGGKFMFTAQCVDLQNKVLQALFSAMTATSYNETAHVAAFCDDFVERYALVLVRFNDASVPDIVMPKVMMNSRPFIQQLKTRASQGNIVGSCASKNVAVQDKTSTKADALMRFSVPNGDDTYVPYTPLLFVPKGFRFFVKRDDDNYTYINFTTGAVSNDIVIDDTYGTWSQPSQQGEE